MTKKIGLLLAISLSIFLLSCAANQVKNSMYDSKGAAASVELKNKARIEGTLNVNLAENPSKIEIKKASGSIESIDMKNISSLSIRSNGNDNKQDQRWLPFRTQKDWEPSATDRKEPVLLLVRFDGEYLMALEEPLANGGSRYFMHIKGEETAFQYYEHDSRGAKAMPKGEEQIRHSFRVFPRVKMAMEAGKLDFKKDDILEYVRLLDREWTIK